MQFFHILDSFIIFHILLFSHPSCSGFNIQKSQIFLLREQSFYLQKKYYVTYCIFKIMDTLTIGIPGRGPIIWGIGGGIMGAPPISMGGIGATAVKE